MSSGLMPSSSMESILIRSQVCRVKGCRGRRVLLSSKSLSQIDAENIVNDDRSGSTRNEAMEVPMKPLRTPESLVS